MKPKGLEKLDLSAGQWRQTEGESNIEESKDQNMITVQWKCWKIAINTHYATNLVGQMGEDN